MAFIPYLKSFSVLEPVLNLRIVSIRLITSNYKPFIWLSKFKEILGIVGFQRMILTCEFTFNLGIFDIFILPLGIFEVKAIMWNLFIFQLMFKLENY